MKREIENLSQQLKLIAAQKKLSIATAESCTGGMLASFITAIPGASDYFQCGFITYSNQSKVDLLNVDSKILDQFGAVSEETARAMAKGCIGKTSVDIALAITGIAGPGGGSVSKPVGTVCFGLATKSAVKSMRYHFEGDREIIRILACKQALTIILNNI